MKWWFPIGCLLIGLVMMVASCETSTTSPRPSPGGEGEARWKLEAIDSLMWKEPDSALAVMMEFAANVEADSMDAFEGHYCQLLISELLYKNDYGQSNRKDLLKAVDYFDSLATGTYGADTRGVSLRRGDGITIKERNVFLDARAHYIKGAGSYEKGDVVQACEEYLNALEMMEKSFKNKEMIGIRARFMALNYNRLGDLFSEQFMMESAIACYESALIYCRIEPTSPNGASNIIYRIGQQFDMKGERNKAREYYGKALDEISGDDNLCYRNLVSIIALCDYQLDSNTNLFFNNMKQILAQAEDEKERLARYLAIGAVFFEEKMYDSAVYYLVPVYNNDDDASIQIQAAECLHSLYQKNGDSINLDACARFLADHKKSEGETKALVSKLEDLFKNYMDRKQKKEAETERKKSIERTVRIIVPIAVAVALAIFIVAKLRGWKKLKQQRAEADKTLAETTKRHEEALKSKELLHEQELKAKQTEALQRMEAVQRSHEEELKRRQAETEHLLEEAERKHQLKVEDMAKRHEAELRIQKDQSEKEIEQTRQRHKTELEAERLAYQKEREELQLNLQLSKRNVNFLQEELGRKRTDAKGHYEAFLREPVCVKINDAVRDLQITTRKPYTSYRINFDDKTLAQFGLVVSAYYGEVKPALLCLYPSIAQEDLLLCYLYLLGMENKQIAVVRQREYSTVRKQAGELKRRLGIDESVRDYVLGVAGVEEFVEK